MIMCNETKTYDGDAMHKNNAGMGSIVIIRVLVWSFFLGEGKEFVA